MADNRMKFHAGMLDRQIEISQRPTTQNEYGQAAEAPVIWRTCFAGKVNVTGQRESEGDGRELSQQRVTWLMRFTDDPPTPRMQFHQVGRPTEIYDIIAVQEVGRRHWWLLTCQQRY